MNIPLPTSLNITEAKGNKATVNIEPCYPGYGVTIGNALRRVLLSSLDGAAITAFKLKDAQHEFTTLPNVKEDVVDLMLNLKKVRLKVFSDEPVILNINAKGQKVVTAGDIEKNAQVEIVNPEQEILTLTDKSAVLEMELTAQTGMGYVTVEDRKEEKHDIGTIMIDAFYTPVINVGFDVENVRVGKQTNYEKIVLKIETDGTVTPEEVIAKSSNILLKHFMFILEAADPQMAKNLEAEVESVEEASESAEAEEEKLQAEEVEDKPKKKRGRPKKTE